MGFRVSKDRNRGKEELGAVEGGVEDRGPFESFTQTLEGAGERSIGEKLIILRNL